MKPILYNKNEKDFTTLGIGTLPDCRTCIVTEQRNGAFEIQFTYPMDGVLFNEIKQDLIVLAKPNEISQPQPFRIYKISKPLNKIVTVYGEHISYQLNSIPVSPFEASSAPEAISGLKTKSAITNPFNFSTSKSTTGNFSIEIPTILRSLLWGQQGSILDTYGGGEFEFNRWDVILRSERGKDSGVVIQYGKNITDLQQDEHISNVLTGVYPYWKKEDEYLELPEKIVVLKSDYSYPRIENLNLSQEFEEKPTIEQLRDAAEQYLNKTTRTTPTVSLSVSFLPLWQTANYKENPLYPQLEGLERVSLCDTVTVKFLDLGVDAKAKVIETEYDVLSERYNKIEIGEPRSNASTQFVEQQEAINEKPSTDMLLEAIQNATNQITGANGGYVVLDPSKNPQRILIMDTPNKETAVRVWQWNLNGLGYSRNGINGPYETAITQDGKIVADFITAGTLNAALANVININASNITTGTIKDKQGLNSINMDTGSCSMNGTFRTSMVQNGITYTYVMNGGGIYLYKDSTLAGQLYTRQWDNADGYKSILSTKQIETKYIDFVKKDGTTKTAFVMGDNDTLIFYGDNIQAQTISCASFGGKTVGWEKDSTGKYVLVGK